MTEYTDISFVRSDTNIFCVSKLDEIQFIFDPCWTSWTTQTELVSFAFFSVADVPLHLALLRFHRITLQSSPPDTSVSLGLNLGKWTWVALEECFFRHSSGTNFFFPSNLKSWMLPLPEIEIVVLLEPLYANKRKEKQKQTELCINQLQRCPSPLSPGNCGAFAYVESPRGGAFAILSWPQGVDISVPRGDPRPFDTRFFERWMSLSGRMEALKFVKDWLIRQGLENLSMFLKVNFRYLPITCKRINISDKVNYILFITEQSMTWTLHEYDYFSFCIQNYPSNF